MIKCCIFDLDGTLLDTIRTITYFVNLTLRHYGYPEISEDECRYFAGNGSRLLIKRALSSRGGAAEGDKYEEIHSFYKKAYDENPLHLTTVFRGIPELLSALRERGIKTAVLSNKPESAVRGVIEHFLPGCFDFVMGAREGTPLKPSPEAPMAILDELSVKPSECALVGDTNTDIETGKNFGAGLSVGVLWGFRKEDELRGAGADFITDRAEEILAEVCRAK